MCGFSDGLSLCEKDQDVSCPKFIRSNYPISMKIDSGLFRYR